MAHAHSEDLRLGNAALPPAGLTRSALAILLRRRGYSLTWLAQAVGLHRSTIIGWQHGGPPNQSAATSAAAALLELGIEPGLLFTTGSIPVDTPIDLDAVRRARGLPTTDNPEEDVMQPTREFLEPEELEYFGLSADPFEDLQDPEDIWRPRDLVRVLTAVEKTVERLSILAVVAPPGAGKSTLMRCFNAEAARAKGLRLVTPATIDRRRITSAALAVAIIRDLTGRETSSMAAEPRSDMLRAVLEDQAQAGHRPALVIDEAHQLKPQALIDLKQIWDSHLLFRRIALIIVGQPALEARLRSDPAVREVAGRTRIVRLDPIKDAGDYMRWRFARVESDADKIFTPEAYRALAKAGAYPLWINNLAVGAMRSAHQLGSDQVGVEHVARA